jgi:hypothetical protein
MIKDVLQGFALSRARALNAHFDSVTDVKKSEMILRKILRFCRGQTRSCPTSLISRRMSAGTTSLTAIRGTVKKIVITAAAMLFAANVTAASVYHGLDAGNTDLNSSQPFAAEVTALQPSVGDRIDIYGRLDERNPDRFSGDGIQSRPSTGRPDISMNLSAKPYLKF